MKTKSISRFILALTVAGLLLAHPLMANTPVQECASRLVNKLQTQVKYPKFALKQAIEGEVSVVFSVNDEGSVIVKDIVASNSELGTYVRDAVANLNCEELKNAGDYDFRVKFHFKLI
jgi:TonB family protein